MTVRIIVQTLNAGAAAHVGGPVWSECKTVLVESEELERLLTAASGDSLCHAQIIGAEILHAPHDASTGEAAPSMQREGA